MMPAVAARANMGPLVRASRPRTTSGRPACRAQAPRAAACRANSSGVRSAPTKPRIPDTLTIRVEDTTGVGSDVESKGGDVGKRGQESVHHVGVEVGSGAAAELVHRLEGCARRP